MKAKLILAAGLLMASSPQLFAEAVDTTAPVGLSLPEFTLNTTNFQYQLVPTFRLDDSGLIITNSPAMDNRIRPGFFEGSLVSKETTQGQTATTETAPASRTAQYFNFADFGPGVDYVTNAPPPVYDPLYFVESSKFDALIPKGFAWKKLNPAQIFRQEQPYEWLEGYELDEWLMTEATEATAQPVELIAWRF